MLFLFQKIRLAYDLFVKPPKVWSRPVTCDILVYDKIGLSEILQYLDGYSVTVLHARGEIINIYVLFLSIFSKRFFTGRFWLAYSQAFIKLSEPRLLITFNDNSRSFYYFSGSCNVVTLFIQNGYRNRYGDIFQHSGALIRESLRENYRVDHMLVFGDNIASEYKKFISGETLVIGSLKNNLFVTSDIIDRNSVRFISQWRPERTDDYDFNVEGEGGRIIGHQEFYQSERFLLPLLTNWCALHGKSFEVIGCNVVLSQYEKDFFDSILGAESYLFHVATSFPGSYRLIDSAEMVISIDSTLGYESLAREKRTACFCIRGRDMSIPFGWPAILSEDGPFWTNNRDPIRTGRILDYISSASDYDWCATLRTHFNGIMEYDPGNQRFRDKLRRVL